jgi:hypothetical protein
MNRRTLPVGGSPVPNATGNIPDAAENRITETYGSLYDPDPSRRFVVGGRRKLSIAPRDREFGD